MHDQRHKSILTTFVCALILCGQASGAERKHSHAPSRHLPISEAPDDIVWGKPKDGISAGIRVRDGIKSYSPNQLLSFELWFRNESDHPQKILLPKTEELNLEYSSGTATFTHVMKERFQKWKQLELAAGNAYRESDFIPRLVIIAPESRNDIEYGYPALKPDGPFEVRLTPVRIVPRSDDDDAKKAIGTGNVRLELDTQNSFKGHQPERRSINRIQIQWGPRQGNLQMGVSALPSEGSPVPIFSPQVWLKNHSNQSVDVQYYRYEFSSPWKLELFDTKPKLTSKSKSGISFVGFLLTHQRTLAPGAVINVSEVTQEYHIDEGIFRASGAIIELNKEAPDGQEPRLLTSGTLHF